MNKVISLSIYLILLFGFSCSNESTIEDGYIELIDNIATVSITFSPAITQTNQSIYYVSGDCTVESEVINVSVGGITTTTSCISDVWSTPTIDVSSLSDGANISISANGVTVSISKATSNPIVSISTPSTIDASNVSTYSLSGTCSETGEVVSVNVGGLIFSPVCSGTSWTTGPQNLTTLGDGTVVVTATHSASGGSPSAAPATLNVTKDISLPTVTISSAPSVDSSNELTYKVSGTCSENGQTVSVSIGGIAVTPTCSSGSWTTGDTNVSALVDSASITVTADHSSGGGTAANQATTTIVKNTASPVISSLSVASTLSTSASLSWGVVNPGGFTVEDYRISFRVVGSPTWITFSDGVSTTPSATVTGLIASTSYEFRVLVVYDSTDSAFSSAVTGTTQPSNPLFEPYTVMNVGGSTNTAVMAFYDTTVLTLPNGTTTTINQGTPYTFVASQFDVLKADKPFFVAGRNGNANVVWNPIEWAGKTFSFSAFRNDPQRMWVYAVEGAYVEVRQGNTVLASATITASGNGLLTWSQLGSYQVVSTGTILAYHMSNGSVDPKPLLPSSNEIIGFPSTRMLLTTTADGTNYTYIHSDSNSVSTSLSRSNSPQINARGSTSLYQSESLIISADQKISGASYADANGSCAAPFLPTNLMRTKYIINVDSDYVAFAGKQAGTIRVFNDSGVEQFPSLTLTRSGANTNAPYRARRGTTNDGWFFISDVPVGGWYQPRTNTNATAQDETILFGTND